MRRKTKRFIARTRRDFITWQKGLRGLTRDTLLDDVKAGASVLEIGPLNRPLSHGATTKYFDVLNTEELKEYARANKLDDSTVPHVDFVSKQADLTTVPEKFDFVVSSHCIEHQPDLIKHLRDALSLLRPGGAYKLIIPDKRYCFDALIPESDVSAVLYAHFQGAKVHSHLNLFRQASFTTHNFSKQHWKGDHGDFAQGESLAELERSYHNTSKQHAEGSYIDAHAWRFTP